jgi:predicted transposase YbfD/YdcC
VTIDAMGCQTAIAGAIADKGADYVLSLKGNQDTIHEDVMTAFSEAHQSDFAGIAHERTETVDKNHERVERRQVWLIHDREYLDYLNPGGKWKQLEGIGAVTA